MNKYQQILHPTFKWKILTICVFCIFASFSHLQAQIMVADCTISQIHTRNNGNFDATANNANGQIFTACEDAEIISLSVTANQVSPSGSGTYDLYIDVEPGNGMSIPTTTPVATLNFISNPGSLEVITFTLATPFPISNGTVYRFFIDFPANNFLRLQTGNDYAGGDFVADNSTHVVGTDLDFQINTQAPSASPAGIPTLSEWGLIILALLLMTLGTLYLVQPSFQQQTRQNS